MAQLARKSSRLRTAARFALGGALVFAGASHLSFARAGFTAQVPTALTDALPFDEDAVVLMSGIVEMGLGAALLVLPKERGRIGLVAASFFTAIFPGNISQFVKADGALGLDTDTKRAVRLLFQPAMVAMALYAGGIV